MTSCPCGFACKLPPDSSEWHRLHRLVHCAVYSRVDQQTLDSLDFLVKVHAEREQERAS